MTALQKRSSCLTLPRSPTLPHCGNCSPAVLPPHFLWFCTQIIKNYKDPTATFEIHLTILWWSPSNDHTFEGYRGCYLTGVLLMDVLNIVIFSTLCLNDFIAKLSTIDFLRTHVAMLINAVKACLNYHRCSKHCWSVTFSNSYQNP